MPFHGRLALTAILSVGAYYLFAWYLYGRDRKEGVIVPRYCPPRDLSPALLRYVWKKEFDDRTFWAGILSLIAKGLATLDVAESVPKVRATRTTSLRQTLPPEEAILLKELVQGHDRTGSTVNMLNAKTGLAAADMANALRAAAIGQWFTKNFGFVQAGIALSAIALVVVAWPSGLEQWSLLILCLLVTAPAAYYFYFLLLRVVDLFRVIRNGYDGSIVRRGLALSWLVVACFASFTFGGILLGAVFGWQTLLTIVLLTVLNVLQIQWMKAPTAKGVSLLAEIEGFRMFLSSVEREPLGWPDAPSERSGLYEKYLPYAIALEVEQGWGDRFVALASTLHESAGPPGSQAFYLGMWDGKPLEIIYKPEPQKGRF